MAARRFRFGCVTKTIMALVVVWVALLAIGYRSARADPVVRRVTVKLPGWPGGRAPVTVALLSDIHIGSPAIDEARLRRVVTRTNALKPDLVLIAGDFVSGEDPVAGRDFARRLTAPLAGLRAPLGVVAVLGNHDHWTAPTEITRALWAAGVIVLANEAIARGPLALIGIDDGFSGHADIARALHVARDMPGARVVLTHTPDTAALLPRGAASLTLAGHTHCGQAVLPLVGSLATLIYRTPLYDARYQCGVIHDPGHLTVVTGGIGGTLPLRYGAPPDLWLLTLGP